MVFAQTAEGSVAPSALGQTKSFSTSGGFFRASRGFTLFRLTALRLPESELARHREPITEADFRPTLAAGKLLDRISAQTKFPRTPDLTDWRFPGPRYIETCALNQAPPAFVLSALSNRGPVPFFASVVPPVSSRLPSTPSDSSVTHADRPTFATGCLLQLGMIIWDWGNRMQ